MQPRLDRSHAPLELGNLAAQRSILVGCRSGIQAFHRHPPQVILGEPERPRQAGQRGAVTGLFLAVLDLSQRGRGDSRPLGEFSLRDAAGRHPVVDDRRDICPVRQDSLLPALTLTVPTVGYRFPRFIDSANKSAKIALQIAFSDELARQAACPTGALCDDKPPGGEALLAAIEDQNFPEP
jgi:hypothetical protein